MLKRSFPQPPLPALPGENWCLLKLGEWYDLTSVRCICPEISFQLDMPRIPYLGSVLKASTRHPRRMPEPPQLDPFDVEHQFFSQPIPNTRAPHPVSWGGPRYASEEANVFFPCIHNLGLSFTTHSSWTWARVGTWIAQLIHIFVLQLSTRFKANASFWCYFNLKKGLKTQVLIPLLLYCICFCFFIIIFLHACDFAQYGAYTSQHHVLWALSVAS